MIEIKGLKKKYRHASEYILNDIDYTFPDSGLFALVGETGSGKSTFLKSVAGLVPSEGTILMDGNHPCDVLADDIGYVFQDFRLGKNEMVLQSVMDGPLAAGYSTKEAEKMAEDALLLCGVDALEEKLTSALSFGQMQRVGIARAMAKHPKYVFADEPTGNLDEDNAKGIMRLFYEISSTALVIVVTHQKELIEPYADSVLTLSDGKLVETKKCEKQTAEACSISKDTKKSTSNKNTKGKVNWIMRRRLSRSKYDVLFSVVLLLFSVLSGICMQLVSKSLSDYVKIDAGYYTKDTYYLTSTSMLQISGDKMMEMYCDSDSCVADPIYQVIGEGTGILVSTSNFSFADESANNRTKMDSFGIYVMNYEEAKKYEFASDVMSPGNGVIIDQSIIDKMADATIDKKSIIGGTFTLYDQKLNGEYVPVSWKIAGISQTGFPFVFLEGIDALSFNYYYRQGFTHRLDELSDITILDADSLPDGYSVSDTQSEERTLIYMNEKARKMICDWDVSYLGFDLSVDGNLTGPEEEKTIIALRNYPDTVVIEGGEEKTIEGVDMKSRFLSLLLKASINMNCILPLDGKSLIEGREPIKEKEYVISNTLSQLVGGLTKANEAVSSLGFTIVGVIDSPWATIYGCGRRECLSSLLSTGNYLTRYPTERGKILGAPRLISYNLEKTEEWMKTKLNGYYTLEKTDELVKKYDKDNEIDNAKTEIIFFSLVTAIEIIFVFAVALSNALSLRESYYVYLSLGYRKKELVLATVLSSLIQFGVPMLIGFLFMAIFFSLFQVLISWVSLIVIILCLLLVAMVHTLFGNIYLSVCQND